jgi:hypothetical protein
MTALTDALRQCFPVARDNWRKAPAPASAN